MQSIFSMKRWNHHNWPLIGLLWNSALSWRSTTALVILYLRRITLWYSRVSSVIRVKVIAYSNIEAWLQECFLLSLYCLRRVVMCMYKHDWKEKRKTFPLCIDLSFWCNFFCACFQALEVSFTKQTSYWNQLFIEMLYIDKAINSFSSNARSSSWHTFEIFQHPGFSF